MTPSRLKSDKKDTLLQRVEKRSWILLSIFISFLLSVLVVYSVFVVVVVVVVVIFVVVIVVVVIVIGKKLTRRRGIRDR